MSVIRKIVDFICYIDPHLWIHILLMFSIAAYEGSFIIGWLASTTAIIFYTQEFSSRIFKNQKKFLDKITKEFDDKNKRERELLNKYQEELPIDFVIDFGNSQDVFIRNTFYEEELL